MSAFCDFDVFCLMLPRAGVGLCRLPSRWLSVILFLWVVHVLPTARRSLHGLLQTRTVVLILRALQSSFTRDERCTLRIFQSNDDFQCNNACMFN